MATEHTASSTQSSQIPSFVALPVEPCANTAFPLDSLKLENDYLAIAEDLDGDASSHETGDAYLAGTNALYHGGPVQWSFVPKVFSRRDVGYLAWIAETMGGIMQKLTRRFIEDAELRRRFGFDARVEGLACCPIPYEVDIPIARVDIFLDERTGDFKFCELNTDGSSGMLVTEEVTRTNLLTQTGRTFAQNHEVHAFDLYSGCADAVLGCIADACGDKEAPVVVAVDYAESIVAEEIQEFQRVFAGLGATLRFADIRDLHYEDGVLYDTVGPVDGVWRRVVISEMLEKPCPGADAFMACVREGKVPVVGGFRTWPCATKTVFAVLHDEISREFLTPDELEFVRRHVPATYMLDASSDLAAFSERERWIAKPRDGYNSVGVRAGQDCTAQEWDDVLHEMAATGGTVQEYVTPFATPNVEGGVAGIERVPEPYMNMEGLFLFRNRFGGVFTRCGQAAVIGEFAGRLNMGCLVAE
ncbi:hypothetical protein [Collinsella sp. An2]|uniref:hypothetical protein n=1 Tax=Collinsella sp. An2 TaxID=1965585 RepID=UPI001EF669BE|nr:hypothetical protein [Collinsella sp. An2]